MTPIDWAVLIATTLFIVLWGTWKHRSARTAEGYLRGGETLSWPTIGLSVMATQASAVTFLSVPGQAYDDGLRFGQFYFGQPLAMIVVVAIFVPIYYRLKVFTAYEYLEKRFDVRVRLYAALLFLVSRSLAAGITIYAPAILLSSILGWSLELTCLVIGVTVVFYTVVGGSNAVSQTQRQQMTIILLGLVAAGIAAALALPDDISFTGAIEAAGALGRLNPVDVSFALTDRYNVWSGLTGGFFLALAYFGTDQSQVGRYLGGRSITESRLGLLFNAVFKIPMQTAILFLGVLVFALYLFARPPVFWNAPTLDAARTAAPALIAPLEAAWDEAVTTREAAARRYLRAPDDSAEQAAARDALQTAQSELNTVRKDAKTAIKTALPHAETEDRDYIFLSFALDYLPKGLLGLLIAVILAAAMSSIASELQALGTTTTVDFHRRLAKRPLSSQKTVTISMIYTIMWGLFAIAFATFASLIDNLIQAVNILGSLFYGTVLGIFLTAFFLKRVSARPTLIAGIIAETLVITLYLGSEIGFLWFNVIGCTTVLLLAWLLQTLGLGSRPPGASADPAVT